VADQCLGPPYVCIHPWFARARGHRRRVGDHDTHHRLDPEPIGSASLVRSPIELYAPGSSEPARRERSPAATGPAISLAIVLAVSNGVGLAASPETNALPLAATNAQIDDLERQVRTLREQLDKLGTAQGSAAQRSLMEQNWYSMQDYMRRMQGILMGPGILGSNGQGDWLIGCPMIGGPSGGWQLPPRLDPKPYRSRMLQQMQRMQDQIVKLGSTSDPAERQGLLKEHWQDIYRNMQTMRGMGWMWGGLGPGGQAVAPLPEPSSPGAKLVTEYCTQCHAAPSPDLHTAANWAGVTSRMARNMKNLNAANSHGVRAPSDEEMKTIFGYMQEFAR